LLATLNYPSAFRKFVVPHCVRSCSPSGDSFPAGMFSAEPIRSALLATLTVVPHCVRSSLPFPQNQIFRVQQKPAHQLFNFALNF
jgi:hypothetical protein